ncbi:MAG: hypothetical protein K2L74_01945, partial [Muribaculaceae bacterium]|nr:hypothetical protein [Muribaculaceae bacterium]
MKKLLLTLLLLFSFGFAATAQEQELELFDVTPANTFSTTGTATAAPTTLTINGYDFTVCNVWWQKSTSNSYMAFKKNGTPAGYMILPKLEGKKITKISMSLPTGVSVKNTKFDIYANETKIGNTVTFTNANEYVAFEVPEANQDENTEFKIVSANTANQIGFGKLKVHYVDASAAGKPSVAYTTSPKEYVLNEGATADNEVDYGTKVTFTAKNFTDTPAIEVFHDDAAAFDAEGNYTITIEEETYVEIKDGETVIAHYNFTPVAAKA